MQLPAASMPVAGNSSLSMLTSSSPDWEEIAMLLRRLVVVGLVGFVAFAANIATAEDAGAPSNFALEGIDLIDPAQAFSDNRFELQFEYADAPRFAGIESGVSLSRFDRGDYRAYEVALVARNQNGLDVAFAQRAGLGVNRDGEITSQTRASELRLGRLTGARRAQPSPEPSWYLFAASEDEALTWRPGMRNEFGGTGSSFNVEDRVDIGDLQAGVTYERNGWQASLAYVEREYSTRTGSRTIRGEEAFTGVTLTMRH
jgi:hypothetical protein